MTQLHQTMMGKTFFERDIPSIAKDLKGIHEELMESNELKARELKQKREEFERITYLKEQELKLKREELDMKIAALKPKQSMRESTESENEVDIIVAYTKDKDRFTYHFVNYIDHREKTYDLHTVKKLFNAREIENALERTVNNNYTQEVSQFETLEMAIQHAVMNFKGNHDIQAVNTDMALENLLLSEDDFVVYSKIQTL